MSTKAIRANGKEAPSAILVRELFDYFPETGKLVWKTPRSNRVYKGMEAGSICGNGYLYVGIGRERYTVQHLAWLHYYEEWPAGVLDHINMNTTDNRIVNLRITDKKGNANNNRAKLQKDYGVYYHSSTGKWRVQLYKEGKHYYYGIFSSREDAVAVANEKRLLLGV